jgi:hypothetical protein
MASDQATDDVIHAAANEVDGQRIIDIEVDRVARQTTFTFDLGAKLVTWPYEDGNDEQWSLMTPSDRAFAYRADGSVSWMATRAPPEDETWTLLS